LAERRCFMFAQTKSQSKWIPASVDLTDAYTLRPPMIVKQCLLSEFSRENNYKRMTVLKHHIFISACVKHFRRGKTVMGFWHICSRPALHVSSV
jgi:hypothetical protein